MTGSEGLVEAVRHVFMDCGSHLHSPDEGDGGFPRKREDLIKEIERNEETRKRVAMMRRCQA